MNIDINDPLLNALLRAKAADDLIAQVGLSIVNIQGLEPTAHRVTRLLLTMPQTQAVVDAIAVLASPYPVAECVEDYLMDHRAELASGIN